MKRAIAQLAIRIAAALVPSARRREWRETWESELFHLSASTSASDPTPLRFAAGALPAAMSELGSEWGAAALLHDVVHAYKRLRSSYAYTALGVLLVTIGISANTSIFAIANAILIRTPPHVADADRLMQIGRLKADGDFDNFSYPNYADIRDQSGAVFSQVAAYGRLAMIGETARGATTVVVHAVTANLFETLGTRMAIGRALSADDEMQRSPMAVVSDAFWRRELGADPGVVGQSLRLDGMAFTVVGVAPRAFAGADFAGPAPAAWIPLLTIDALSADARSVRERGYSWLWVVGRLAPGVSVDHARAAANVIHHRLAAQHAGTLGVGLALAEGVGLRPDERAEAEQVSALLMGVVGIVLLIACANLGGLVAAQSAGRVRDLTVCAALGASRLRLTRELVAEQLLTALAGAMAAYGLTWWTAQAVQSSLPYDLAIEVAPDWRVFVFAITIAAATSLVFGVLPAYRSARVDVVKGLRESNGGHLVGAPRGWWATAQLALSLMLVVGAGLLVRSMIHARSANPGFDVDAVAAVQVHTELLHRSDPQRATRTILELITTAQQQPGVVSAAIASHLPVAMSPRTRSLRQPGADLAIDPPSAVVNYVSPSYFNTLGIPLVRGRGFSSADNAPGAPRPVIVSESTAQRLWPDREAIGERLQVPGDAEVIGVVADVRLRSLNDRNGSAIYLPFPAHTEADLVFVVRTAAPDPTLPDRLVAHVRAASSQIAVSRGGRLRDLLGRSYAETQMLATLLITFSLIASVLAAAGVYVVLATWVVHSRRDLAVRLALGAAPSDLRRMVIRRALRPTLAGLVLGSVGAAFGASALERLLFGVTSVDPLTYMLSSVALLGIAMLAGYVPVRTAMRADPMSTLKGV